MLSNGTSTQASSPTVELFVTGDVIVVVVFAMELDVDMGDVDCVVVGVFTVAEIVVG